MVSCIEGIGIERLSGLKGADSGGLAMRIDMALGRRHMNRLGVAAPENLVVLAEPE